MGCAADDEGDFVVVGKRGRAVPKKIRCDLASLPCANKAPSRRDIAEIERRPAWPHQIRPPLSVAPMMEWTDVHYRTMARFLTKRTLLFTEMYPAENIIAAAADGTLERLLAFDAEHRPLAVQIGGCCPTKMGQAAALCAEFGYDEINLNVGCPSPKVTCNHFGACLMKEPGLVRSIAQSVRATCCTNTEVPITVKHRLGVDDYDSWEELTRFVQEVAAAGVNHFTVHARKALLGVLSPEGNRTIPPLRYDWVFALARTFPELHFELNGGVQDLQQAQDLLSKSASAPLSGIMIGRAAYKTPWILATADSLIFGDENPGFSRGEVLKKYLDYAAAYFNAQQRLGLVPTPAVAFELEHAMAAPVSYLFHDVQQGFHDRLVSEVEARDLTTTAGLPSFMLRRAVARAMDAERMPAKYHAETSECVEVSCVANNTATT